MAAKKDWEVYTKIKKTKEMNELFKRKSGAISKRPSRTKEKEEWIKEVIEELSNDETPSE